jgi:histidinol-phosphate/aromatic aminotransferase/cobyric acid decarboxylase-like protein
MRILIKENNRTKFSLWLPTSNLAIAAGLRYIDIDGKKLSREKRKMIMKELKRLRKIHKPLAFIEVFEKNGNYVLIKI